MPTTNYFDHVIDPATGQSIEVRDTYAREQLIHKTEKTTVNSLPPKPTDKESWLAMERFLYYVPVEGQTDQYEAWTLFFVGDPTVASDYTDTDNYKWVKIDTTESDFENFSTKGHTHEVVTEVSVEDHEFVPQGTVSGEFEGTQGTTETDGTHNHTFTPSGNVTSSFSGTQGNTGNAGSHQHSFTPSGSVSSSFSGSQGNTSSEGSHTHSFTPSGDVTVTFEGTEGNTDNDGEHTHTLTKTKKKLSTKKLSVTPATSVDFTGSTTNAQRATGSLETLQSYDASKAVFNGIAVQDGVLSFVTKKMSTADTVSALQASVDASKVTLDNSGTVSQQDVATGQLSDGSANDPTVLADASVDTAGEHSHTFTPAGTAEGTFVGTSGNTGAAGEHQHTFTPSGTVTSTFTGTGGDTGSAGEHNHSFTPSGSVTSSFSGTQGTTGNAGSHTHGFTPSGNVEAGFQGVRTVLKHKVNNGKVRTAPDTEDEGSHAFDWYGILFDEDEMDPHKTRVGNMDMHRMLPIQTKMRRCLLNDDGTVNYYLDDRDSTKKTDGTDAVLDGTDGQVMVEIPEHWRKVYRYLDGTKTMLKAMVSPYPQTTTGWIHVNKGYVSAYEASIVSAKLCSISDVKDLELSVVDGNVNALCDVSTIGETGKPADWAAYIAGTHSKLPTTNVTMDTLRTAARARGNTGEYKWNMLVYEQYLALYWLFVIEYANLNSQEAFTTALTSEGFHQGGLGEGATSILSATWDTFNAFNPFVPCGVTNCLGNQSGEVLMSIPTLLGGGTVRVNSYRGVEMPFGHIWKFADGIKYLGNGTNQDVLRCDNPANYSSSISSSNYESIGTNTGSYGYKTKIMVGDDGDINVKEVGGGANTAFCDYNVSAFNVDVYYCCLLGGSSYYGALAGLAYVFSLRGVPYLGTTIGSRLCFYNV